MRGLIAIPAKQRDARDISVIHAYCWQQDYKFMPPEVLRRRDQECRENQWEAWFANPGPSEALYKVLNDGEIVGFCFCKENDDIDLPEARGELHAGYILPEHRGGIAGPLIILTMSRFLRERNCCPISLWSFKQNRARLWYGQLGFKKVIARDRIIQGHAIPEFGYVHPDVDQLIDHLEFLVSREPA